MAEGLLYYFPNALAAVARVSKAGNDQHNPGQPMHHARGKSMDHADCIIRHLVDAGTIDTDGQRHSAKVAWRALALLQEEIEREEGVPLPRNARPGWQVIECGGCAPPVIATPSAYTDALDSISAKTHPAGIGDVPKWSPEWATHWVNPVPQVLCSHPMNAEAIRDHDERLSGGESRL
jgi:hypothetical protein